MTYPSSPIYQQQSDYTLSDTTSPAFILNKPANLSLDIQNRNASVSLGTTPSVFMPQTVAASNGITYDTLTGIVTLPETRVYTTFTILNIQSGNNRSVYTYAEINLGSGWIISQYSGRDLQVGTQNDGQRVTVSVNLFQAGTQLRFPVWASGTGVTLVSVNLPGTTPGTVISPAYRLLIGA